MRLYARARRASKSVRERSRSQNAFPCFEASENMDKVARLQLSDPARRAGDRFAVGNGSGDNGEAVRVCTRGINIALPSDERRRVKPPRALPAFTECSKNRLDSFSSHLNFTDSTFFRVCMSKSFERGELLFQNFYARAF